MARPPITPEQEAEIRKLRSEGLSERAIASQTGLSKTVVHNRVTGERVTESDTQALPQEAAKGRVYGLLPRNSPPMDTRPGLVDLLNRNDAAREARIGRAPGQPASSVLEPAEWIAHQERLARINCNTERAEHFAKLGREWSPQP